MYGVIFVDVQNISNPNIISSINPCRVITIF